jgi:hypothetical protein
VLWAVAFRQGTQLQRKRLRGAFLDDRSRLGRRPMEAAAGKPWQTIRNFSP